MPRTKKTAASYSTDPAPNGVAAALWMRGLINRSHNELDYFKLGIFYRLLSDLSTTIAEVEPQVYLFQDGRKIPIPDHRVSRAFRDPSVEHSAFELRRIAAARYLFRWNSFVEIVPDNGAGSFFLELPPDQWISTRSSNGEFLGYFDRKGEALDGKRLLHFKGIGLDGFAGYELWKHNLEASLGLHVFEYANSYFEHGTNLDGFFTTDFALPPAEKEALDKKLEKSRGPENAHKKDIFSGNLKWNSMGNTALDSQLLESRKASISELASCFGLTDKYLTDGLTDETWQSYLAVVCRHLSVFEAEYSQKLLTREERQSGLFVEHDLAPLRRSQGSAKVDDVVKVAGYGVLDVDEMRDSLNLPPLPNGEGRVRLIATNNLDSIGNLQPAPTSPLATTQEQDKPEAKEEPKDGTSGQPGDEAVKAVFSDQVSRTLVRGRKAIQGSTPDKLSRSREREAQYAREVLPAYAILAGIEPESLLAEVVKAFETEKGIEQVLEELWAAR